MQLQRNCHATAMLRQISQIFIEGVDLYIKKRVSSKLEVKRKAGEWLQIDSCLVVVQVLEFWTYFHPTLLFKFWQISFLHYYSILHTIHFKRK